MREWAAAGECAESFFFGAVHELEVALTEPAKRLGMSPAGVGYAVQRGTAIVNENGYRLPLKVI
jgi:hypothetical protein